MDQWEYLTVALPMKKNGLFGDWNCDDTNQRMNQLGRLGWKLVTSYTFDVYTVFAIFKRKKQAD